MGVMTKIDGVPDREAVVPGMAFFPGTGPAGATCAKCIHKGYYRTSERSGDTYRVNKCAMFRKMSGRHGSDVAGENKACKYFEPLPKGSGQ